MSTRTDLLSALSTIDSEIAETEERLAELRLDRRGAEAILKRLGFTVDVHGDDGDDPAIRDGGDGDAAVTASLPSVTRGGVGEGNAKFVAEVMAATARVLSLAEIEQLVAQHGHELDNEQVRSAVTYLRKRGVAERVSRGMWRYIPADSTAPTNADSPTESAGLSVLTIPSTEGGEAGAETTTDREDQLSRWNVRNGHHPSVMEG